VKDDAKWKPYNFDYEKEWYDIELQNGDIIYQCYPNAGWFHSEHLGLFSESMVKRFRRCKHPLDEDIS
jgi:hypothetical protein